jgi:hypothetical protein
MNFWNTVPYKILSHNRNKGLSNKIKPLLATFYNIKDKISIP